MSIDTIPQDEAKSAERTPAQPNVVPPKKSRPWISWASFAWLGLVILLAVLAPVLPIKDYAVAAGAGRLAPQLGGGVDLLFGTDNLGRSIFSRAIYGAQVSLVVGAVAGLCGFLIGSALGLVAGFRGGRVDWVITLITDAMLAFPPLILLLALASILTPSVPTIMLGLTILTIPAFVRLARANTIAWRSREFVRAARNMGASDTRILIREILPNVLPALGAYLPIVVAALIVAEGSLSFLGFGVPPPTPSWGGMISDGKDSLAKTPHMVFVPAAIIFFTVFSLNQAGDHLRHRFDRTMH